MSDMDEITDETIPPIPNHIDARAKQYFLAVIVIIVIIMLLYAFM